MPPSRLRDSCHEHKVNGRRVTCLPVVMSYTCISAASMLPHFHAGRSNTTAFASMFPVSTVRRCVPGGIGNAWSSCDGAAAGDHVAEVEVEAVLLVPLPDDQAIRAGVGEPDLERLHRPVDPDPRHVGALPPFTTRHVDEDAWNDCSGPYLRGSGQVTISVTSVTPRSLDQLIWLER